MKVRVLQGHSICFRGAWFNQGEVIEVPAGTVFLTNVPKFDQAGKRLGDEIVDQVEEVDEDSEVIDPADKGANPETKKEEG